jgi:aminopeptidase N
MCGLAKWVRLILVATMASACSDPGVETQPGVPLELAQTRSAVLENIHYKLRFEILPQEHKPIVAAVGISFELAENSSPLQLDYRNEEGGIQAMRVNGEEADVKWVNEHIVLPGRSLRRGSNLVEIDFIAGDTSLNRNPEFLYTLFVPDRARTAFPLFDQPDLKARYELALVVPSTWKALANAPEASVKLLPAERTEYEFAPTEPISSYLFSFVAGEFQSITREVNGREMTLLHRETDAAKVARNVDAIFELHGESLAWLEHYTGIDYPFQKFDFVLIPSFPYGGMEHVGAIQYRASSLMLDDEPPLTDQLNRAQLIAHETAHMWFGNLVTMRWFDDVWTKEVFANFMADKIVNPGFPEVDHALNFLVNHYPAAYAVDRSEGANPIRQPLSNLNQAGQLYGNIIYHKAPIMMRQLELIVGEEGLREGLAEYLKRFSYANASWPDLIAILDKRTDIDLAAWSEVWVNTPGRPEFRLLPADSTGAGTYQLLQRDPAGLGRVWPQQFDLLSLGVGSEVMSTFMAVADTTPVPGPMAGESAPVQLFNADGRGYGLFPASMEILLAWDQLQAVQKGSALIGAYDQLMADPDFESAEYFGLLLEIVQREQDPLLLNLALGQLQYIYQSLLPDPLRMALTTVVEDILWAKTLAQTDSSRTKLVFRYFSVLASSDAQVRQLLDIWSGTLVVDKLILEEEDRIDLAQTLAIRLPEQSDEIIAVQLANISNPDSRRRLEFIAPSLSADQAVRDTLFESLRDRENRHTESWVSDAVANLHHPSRLGQSEKYLLPSLELLQEIQVTGDIFFPSDWLRATLGNYYSISAARTVRDFLAARPGYNPQLRMKILQAADGLFRATAIRGAELPPAQASVRRISLLD